MYDPTLRDRIQHDFKYHPPTPEQVPAFTAIRDRAREYALYLEETVPHGRELSRALSALEDTVMHANAGVARHGVRATDG